MVKKQKIKCKNRSHVCDLMKIMSHCFINHPIHINEAWMPLLKKRNGEKNKILKIGSMGKGGCLHKKEFPFLFGWTGQYNVYEL